MPGSFFTPQSKDQNGKIYSVYFCTFVVLYPLRLGLFYMRVNKYSSGHTLAYNTPHRICKMSVVLQNKRDSVGFISAQSHPKTSYN